jgi:hypothetical protein
MMLVQRGQQHLLARGLEHQRVAGVVDVLAGAGEVHELAGRLQLRLVGKTLLIQYSTALTSWLVVFSMSLMA